MTTTAPKPGFGLALLMTFAAMAGQAVLGIAVELGGFILGQILGRPAGQLTHQPFTLAVINSVVFGAVIFWGVKLNGGPARPVLSFRPVPARLVGVAILTMLGVVVLLSEVDNAFRWLFPPPEFLLKIFRDLMGPAQSFWAAGLLLVVVAPVTEELLFRGILLRGLAFRHRWRTALLLSSLLFALMHANPWQFCSAATAGMVFGWWYLRTGSLVLCLLGHALMNSLALTLPLLAEAGLNIPGLTGDPLQAETQFQPWWLDLAGLALAGTGLLLFHRLAPRPIEPPPLLPQLPAWPPPAGDAPLPPQLSGS